MVGKKVENYEILAILGKGGMGTVYKAYDTKLDRYVAIKVIRPEITSDPHFIERFKREAKNQAQLSHPNIAIVYGFIEAEGILGIVMEYVEGDSLDKVITRQKRLHLSDATYILRQMLAGVGYAHSKGFIHRDIKPSNIIFNKEGVAKIMDFGISKSFLQTKFTKTGAKVGTIYYMSPEQIEGNTVTHHSDIYSLGATYYEMITGRPPYLFESEYKVMEGHLKHPYPRISDKLRGMPPAVDKVLSVALAKNPGERYQNCDEFITALDEIDEAVSNIQKRYLKKIGADPDKRKRNKPGKTLPIVATTVIIAVIIGLAYFVYSQVNTLLNSKKFDELQKYSISTLFEDREDFKFKKIHKAESNTIHSFNAIDFIDEKNAIAIGDSGLFATTSDSGLVWNSLTLDSTVNYNDIHIFKNGKSYIVGNKAALLYSNNYFNQWQEVDISRNHSLFTIHFINEKTGFAAGSKGFLLRTTDGGNSWSTIETKTDEILYDIYFIDESNGFIVGWNGTLLKSSDGGNKWEQVDIDIDKYLKAIDFYDKKLGIIVGGGGVILKTENGGDSWEKKEFQNLVALHSAKFVNKNTIIAAGSKGALLISKDTGETWQQVDSGTYTNFKEISISPDNKIFIVGVNGSILKIL